MAFPTSNAQQAETNRKILEDIQLKKQQLLQKGGTAGNIIISQMPSAQLLGQPAEFQQPNASSSLSAPRSVFNPTSSTTLGFFIPQDSYFGNSFIPVLPRLEPISTQQQQTTPTPGHNTAK